MENGKTFETTGGYCHLLPAKIVLTKDEIIGINTSSSSRNTMPFRLMFLSTFVLLNLGGSVYFFQNNQILESIILLLGFLYTVWFIITNINVSDASIIDRKSIIEVKFKNRIIRLIHSRFEVFFVDEKGKTKKIIIPLKGSSTNEETVKAIKLMRTEGLMGFDV